MSQTPGDKIYRDMALCAEALAISLEHLPVPDQLTVACLLLRHIVIKYFPDQQHIMWEQVTAILNRAKPKEKSNEQAQNPTGPRRH